MARSFVSISNSYSNAPSDLERHGVASSPGVNFSTDGDFSHATSFLQPILMGAAFDDKLIFDVATVVSTEARAFNNFNRAGLDFWTPNINPFRDPRWERGQGQMSSFQSSAPEN